MRENSSTQRNRSVDVAKGLGITLVVFGHSMYVMGNMAGEMFRVIWSFHMPLFFLLGGLFVRTSHSMLHVVKSRANGLLKPYFAVLAIYTILATLAALARGKPIEIARPVARIVYGSGATIPVGWGPLWFLPHMFLAILCATVWCKLWDGSKNSGRVALVVTLGVAWYLGVLYLDPHMALPWTPESWFGKNPGLPWGADLLPVTAPFVAVGYLLRDRLLHLRPTPAWLLIGPATFVLLHLTSDHYLDYHARIYTSFVVSTLLAFSGVVSVLCIAVVMDSFDRLGAFFEYLGKASLVILMVHSIFTAVLYWKLFSSGVEFHLANVMCIVLGISAGVLVYAFGMRYPRIGLFYLPIAAQQSARGSKANETLSILKNKIQNRPP